MKRTSLLALCLFMLFAAKTSGQGIHCGFKQNTWLNPYRNAILKAGGVVEENSNGKFSYVSKPPSLVAKPVDCLFSFDDYGKLKNLRILKGSGDKTVDEKAMSLIRKAAPFRYDPSYSRRGEILIARFTPVDVTIVSTLVDRI